MQYVEKDAAPQFHNFLALDFLPIPVGGHVAIARGKIIAQVFGWTKPKPKSELAERKKISKEIGAKADKLMKASQTLKIESGSGVTSPEEQRHNYDRGQAVLDDAISMCGDVLQSLANVMQMEGGMDPQMASSFFKGVATMKDLAKTKGEFHNYAADKYAPKKTVEATEEETGGFIMGGNDMTQMAAMFEKRMAIRSGKKVEKDGEVIDAEVVDE